jgi:hypothetical protein
METRASRYCLSFKFSGRALICLAESMEATLRVWSYFGEGDRRALTPNATDDQLPTEFAPWVRYQMIDLDESDEVDRHACNAIEQQGFYLYRRSDHA